MDAKQLNLYRQFRKLGQQPSQAKYSALTVAAFRSREDEDVRLRLIDEEESYFDVYGKPDDEREYKRICDLIERLGNYCVTSEYKLGDDWELANSVGHCCGYEDALSPFENWYVIDLMAAAMQAADNQVLTSSNL